MMVKLLMNVETSSEGKGPIGVERCTSWGGPMHGNPLHVRGDTSKIARGEEVDGERRVIDLRDGQYSGATTTDGDCLPCRVP